MVEFVRAFVYFKIFILFCAFTRNFAFRYRPILSFITGQPPRQSHIFPQLSDIINKSEYTNNIYFNYYTKNGTKVYQTNIRKVENFGATECDPKGNFAIIVPGWRENCDEQWVNLLISKLNQYRGGCIICMNYGYFAFDLYTRLVQSFDSIAHILHLHLLDLERVGFNLREGYMFGFSYGGRLICEAAQRLGTRIIKDLDVCDSAGPIFDFRPQTDLKLSAQNVQCIHTSRIQGTRYFNCHQDWRMGNCGFTQDAASIPPMGSHGLCPHIYISAFENNFYAVEKPVECLSENLANHWPGHFKMGYLEGRKSEAIGELFAYTSATHPYNVPENQSVRIHIGLKDYYDEADEDSFSEY